MWKYAVGSVLILLLACALLVWKVFVAHFTSFLLVYSVAVTIHLTVTLYLALHYQSVRTKDDFLPTVSVLIPVYNEPYNVVRKTVHHALETDYGNLTEIIIVDDGSTTDLPQQLPQLEAEFEPVRVVLFPQNKGNKFARAEGIRNATSEIVVFIDSDTYITPHGIRELIQPFQEATVGAVSGHLHVFNTDGFLQKMQAAWYFSSFRVYRGAEDRLSLVTCCPGAFSAYRREAITPELEQEWLYGKFMGLEVNAGVDRALTNYVSREYDVRYQRQAEAYTIVPTTLRQFWRQQARWSRSWIRENFAAATFLHKRGLRSYLFYSAFVLHLANYIILFKSLFYDPIVERNLWTGLFYLLGLALVGLLYGMFAYKHRFWVYRVFFPMLFCWLSLPLFVYSLYTLRSKSWLTR